jgi:hypothetical protein
MALNGKGAFRRFKDTLHRVDDQWLQAWYQWKDKRLKAAVDEWVKRVLELNEKWDEDLWQRERKLVFFAG